MKKDDGPLFMESGSLVCEMERGGGRRFLCPSGLVLLPNLPPQESFDYPKGGYVRDSWEDVFSSCEGSAGKLLDAHFLRDGSRLGEDVSGQ